MEVQAAAVRQKLQDNLFIPPVGVIIGVLKDAMLVVQRISQEVFSEENANLFRCVGVVVSACRRKFKEMDEKDFDEMRSKIDPETLKKYDKIFEKQMTSIEAQFSNLSVEEKNNSTLSSQEKMEQALAIVNGLNIEGFSVFVNLESPFPCYLGAAKLFTECEKTLDVLSAHAEALLSEKKVDEAVQATHCLPSEYARKSLLLYKCVQELLAQGKLKEANSLKQDADYRDLSSYLEVEGLITEKSFGQAVDKAISIPPGFWKERALYNCVQTQGFERQMHSLRNIVPLMQSGVMKNLAMMLCGTSSEEDFHVWAKMNSQRQPVYYQ